MDNKIFTIILVAVVGVVLGVGVVSQQAKEPVVQELLRQQSEIVKGQEKLIQQMGSDSPGGAGLAVIEQRLSAIEGKMQVLEPLLAQLKNAPQRLQPPQEDFSTVHNIDVAHSYIIGKKDAPVTITEFVDFECPFCARFHEPVQEVLKAYPNQVNYLVKNFPLSFHPNAKSAAKAAFAAGIQGKYGEMVDKLLENGRNLNEDAYERFAKEIGLNVEKFLKDYKEKDSQWEEYINKDMTLGSQVEVRGTPTFFINGRKTRARDFAGFKQEIDEILNNL